MLLFSSPNVLNSFDNFRSTTTTIIVMTIISTFLICTQIHCSILMLIMHILPHRLSIYYVRKFEIKSKRKCVNVGLGIMYSTMLILYQHPVSLTSNMLLLQIQFITHYQYQFFEPTHGNNMYRNIKYNILCINTTKI